MAAQIAERRAALTEARRESAVARAETEAATAAASRASSSPAAADAASAGSEQPASELRTIGKLDSMAIFLVGQCAGIRRIFDPSVISSSAVAEEPWPPSWKNVQHVLRDAEGKETGREPHKLPRYSLEQTSHTLDKYQPKMAERMTRFLKWTFEPALEPDSPAMTGPRHASQNDSGAWPIRVGPPVGKKSWDWPMSPVWNQKLISVDKFDPWEKKSLAMEHTCR